MDICLEPDVRDARLLCHCAANEVGAVRPTRTDESSLNEPDIAFLRQRGGEVATRTSVCVALLSACLTFEAAFDVTDLNVPSSRMD